MNGPTILVGTAGNTRRTVKPPRSRNRGLTSKVFSFRKKTVYIRRSGRRIAVESNPFDHRRPTDAFFLLRSPLGRAQENLSPERRHRGARHSEATRAWPNREEHRGGVGRRRPRRGATRMPESERRVECRLSRAAGARAY